MIIKIRVSCAYVVIQKKYYLYVYIHVNDVLILAFFYRKNNNLGNLIHVEKWIQKFQQQIFKYFIFTLHYHKQKFFMFVISLHQIDKLFYFSYSSNKSIMSRFFLCYKGFNTIRSFVGYNIVTQFGIVEEKWKML